VALPGAQAGVTALPVLPVSASLGGESGVLNDVTGITSLTSSGPGGCTATLALTAEADAMIGVMLNTPCIRSGRVVLHHAGLTFTAKTSADGIVALSLPAFETEAEVLALDAQGELARASVAVADAAAMRRFALSWMSEDVIDLRINEGDLVFVSRNEASDVLGNQRLMGFGDRSVATPMLAKVYTYPADPATKVEIQVEIGVTPANCGRDIAVDVIAGRSGMSDTSKVSISIPPCDAAGDILVLKNLAPDTKIAADN